MKNFIFILSVLVGTLNPITAWAEKSKVVVLYTQKPSDTIEEFDDLNAVAQFAFDQFDKENGVKLELQPIAVDDKDDPEHTKTVLKKVFVEDKPVAVIGPLYSNVAMGVKDLIGSQKIPMVSIFATHNNLTKDSKFIFRICASNRRLVKGIAEYLFPEIQKHNLNLIVFKDLNDEYSMNLADTFRLNIQGLKTNYNEVLFRGVKGLQRLQDLNAKIWNPTRKDVLFLPLQDITAGHIIAALESFPNMIASVDSVDLAHLTKKIKSQKTHIKLINTSQWLPQKSDYSKKVEEEFKKKFGRPMTITTALTYDAAYTTAAAFKRAQAKHVPLADALRDSARVTGVTGLIILGQDGERVLSDVFIQDSVIE